MNKKGFTLVELLAVIVILALLALLTSTAVTKLVKDAKDDLSETQIQLIKSAADTWIAENLNSLPSSGSCSYLTLEDLKYYGLLDNVILDPKNSEEIPNDLKIKITTSASAYGNPVTNSEVNPESIEGCSQIYFPICTLAEDSTVQGLNAGAKYNCKVDPNKAPYTFFVLTNPGENSTTVNLIMDSNININGEAVKSGVADLGLIQWISNDDFLQIGGNQNDYNIGNFNIYGPITPMNYLQKATSNWTNLNIMTVNIFTDNNGNKYDMSKTYKTYARMPYYSEVGASNGENEYLYENLDSSLWEGVGEKPSNNVSGIIGYWILSKESSSTITVWYVYNEGFIYTTAAALEGNNGVRPVITVPINRITQ